METGISRRGLVAGAATGAAALAAAGAAVSGGAALAEEGAAAAAGQARARWSWEQAPEAPADSEVAEAYDSDVCVIGAGSAGVPAALYASTHGLSVVVLQKWFSTQSNGWSFAAFNTRHDAECGITYDPVATRDAMAEYGSGRSNVDVICSIMDKSGACLDWLTDQVADKMPLSIATDIQAGFPDSRVPHCVYYWMRDGDYTTRYYAFDDALALMAERAQGDGARFLYSTPAVRLFVEDGKVTGAFGQAEDGSVVRVNASKGVLIATGDVTDDPEMVEYFIPGNIGIKNMSPYGTCTGDGHKMARWAGARWDCPPLCQGFSTGVGHDNYDGGVAPAYSDPALRVNKAGRRFVNEYVTAHNPAYGGSPLMTADALQPGHMTWSIYDKKLSPKFQLEDIESLVGVSVWTGDTLAEVAEQAGIDAEGLEETVARYNEIVASGEDSDYGVSADVLAGRDVTEPPFYAVKREPLNMAAIGGIQADPSMRVIDGDGEPIPGLYVAGNAMGACYGYEYPWSHFAASNKMHAMAGGILAVRSMMGILDEEFE